tara:strand:- start:59 stop:334 length:276 start_codon:yes stop_codon:yes gene_type:complete
LKINKRYTMTLDQLEQFLKHREGENGMIVNPKDNFVLFYADQPKKNENSPDFKGILNGANGEKLPIVAWTKDKDGKQYISGVVNEEYKKED